MANLLLIIVAILAIAWLVGVIAFGQSGVIHTLLLIVFVTVLIFVLNRSRKAR